MTAKELSEWQHRQARRYGMDPEVKIRLMGTQHMVVIRSSAGTVLVTAQSIVLDVALGNAMRRWANEAEKHCVTQGGL